MKTRVFGAIAVAIILLPALTACWREYTPQAHVERAEVLGVWSIDRDDSSATLELFEDGTVYAAGWPTELMCVTQANTPIRDIGWDTPEDSAGTFSFTPPRPRFGSEVTITLDKGCGVHYQILIDDEDGLYFNVYVSGDPDLRGPDDIIRFFKNS